MTCGSRAIVDSLATFRVAGNPTCTLPDDHICDHRGDGYSWSKKYDGLFDSACLDRWGAWQRSDGGDDMEIDEWSLAVGDVIVTPGKGDIARVGPIRREPFAMHVTLIEPGGGSAEVAARVGHKVAVQRRQLTPLQVRAARYVWDMKLKLKVRWTNEQDAARQVRVLCDTGEDD